VDLSITLDDATSDTEYYAIRSDTTAPGTGDWLPHADGTFNVSKAAPAAEGSTPYYVWAKDKAGNTTTSYVTVRAYYDKTPPTVTAEAGYTATSGGNVDLAITLDDATSDIDYYAIRSDTTAPGTGDWVLHADGMFNVSKAAPTTEGSTPYYVWAKDKAGNTTTSYVTVRAYYDKTPPTVSVSTVTKTTAGNYQLTGSSITDSGTSASGVASFALSTDNTVAPTDWLSPYSTPISYTVSLEGSYYLWGKDNAGNTACSAAPALIYHASAPFITLATYGKSTTLDLTVTVAAGNDDTVSTLSWNTTAAWSDTQVFPIGSPPAAAAGGTFTVSMANPGVDFYICVKDGSTPAHISNYIFFDTSDSGVTYFITVKNLSGTADSGTGHSRGYSRPAGVGDSYAVLDSLLKTMVYKPTGRDDQVAADGSRSHAMANPGSFADKSIVRLDGTQTANAAWPYGMPALPVTYRIRPQASARSRPSPAYAGTVPQAAVPAAGATDQPAADGDRAEASGAGLETSPDTQSLSGASGIKKVSVSLASPAPSNTGSPAGGQNPSAPSDPQGGRPAFAAIAPSSWREEDEEEAE
jgi:hypothetical protein